MQLTRKILTREGFMVMFIAGLSGIGGVILGVPIVGWVLGPLLKPPKQLWRDVGAASSFKVGDTVAVTFRYPSNEDGKWSGKTQFSKAWLQRRSSSQFIAYAVYCTHLGCPVAWIQSARLFLCPCHGSVFNGDGVNVGGPAPRPLFQYQTRVVNGRVFVKTAATPLTT